MPFSAPQAADIRRYSTLVAIAAATELQSTAQNLSATGLPLNVAAVAIRTSPDCTEPETRTTGD